MLDHSNGRGSMVALAANVISRERDAMGEWAEAGRRPPGERLTARELEEVIDFGNYVFQRLRAIDLEWAAQACGAATPPLMADAQAMQALYLRWRDRAQALLEEIAGLEGGRGQIRGADRLAAAYAEVEAAMSLPVDRFRAAVRDAGEGRTRPHREIRDALRRRVGAGG